MSWLYVHLPQLALDVRSRGLPPEQPLALIEPGRVELLLVNAAAAAAGIRPGMSVSTAYCLHPELLLVPRDPLLEQHSLLDLAQLLYAFAAQISIKPPQGLLLEIGSMLKLHGGLDRLWQQLQDCLQRQGFSQQLAVAATPLAAQLLAQAGTAPCSLDPQLLRAHLHALPSDRAGLPPTMAERLQRMGLKQLGQVLALPAAELGKRFGPDLLLHLARLQGEVPDPQHFFTPPELFVRRLEFVAEVEQMQGLLFPLQRLLQELGEFLRLRQRVCDSLSLEIGHRDQPPRIIQVQSAQPEHRPEEWLQLCRLKLEGVQLYTPALSLCLRMEQQQNLQAASDDLFLQQQRQQLSQQQLLSRLRTKLGEDAVQGLACVDDHRPERAWRLQPVQPAPARSRAVASSASTSATAAAANPRPALGTHATDAPRPLWLLPKPQAIQARKLRLLRGPERIQAGWWEHQPTPTAVMDAAPAYGRFAPGQPTQGLPKHGQPGSAQSTSAQQVSEPGAGTRAAKPPAPQPQVSRDYYLAQTQEGSLCWAFRDALGQWFVHGWFG